MNEKEQLYRAAAIKIEMKKLEEEYEQLTTSVISSVASLAPDTLRVEVGELGKFSISYRKLWEYNDTVTALDEKLKAIKREQEQLGIATMREVPSLRFTPNEQ